MTANVIESFKIAIYTTITRNVRRKNKNGEDIIKRVEKCPVLSINTEFLKKQWVNFLVYLLFYHNSMLSFYNFTTNNSTTDARETRQWKCERKKSRVVVCVCEYIDLLTFLLQLSQRETEDHSKYSTMIIMKFKIKRTQLF